MKCNNCGYENEQSVSYCVNCGYDINCQNVQQVEPVTLNPTADIVMPALKDKLFLTLCILMSVSSVLTIAAGGMPLIYILITVFMWLTYADAQKGIVNEKHIQGISGTVYASYVILNIFSVLIIAFGALFGFLYSKIQGDVEAMTELTLLIEESGVDLSAIPQLVIDMFGWFLSGLLVFMGIIILVFNNLMTRTYHRFVKSVYKGVMYQNPNFEKVTSARNWLVVFAVLNAILLVNSMTAAIPTLVSTACSVAIGVIASKIINKHFV